MSAPNDNALGKESVEALDRMHCFGSRWFCLQMQEAFNGQSAILREIVFKHSDGELKRVAPLIHGLATTSEAIALLRRDNLLNEAHVLMRVLIERALNLCYLLTLPNGNLEQAREKTNAEPIKDAGAKELIEAAKTFRFAENYDIRGLRGGGPWKKRRLTRLGLQRN